MSRTKNIQWLGRLPLETVYQTIGRATIGVLVTPAGSIGISILVVIGIIALYWLQRLLESEEESSS